MRHGIGVGLKLVFARQLRKQRCYKGAEKRQHHNEQQQRQRVIGATQIRHHAQPDIKPGLATQAAEQGKAQQAQGEHGNNAFLDMAVLEMSQFMGQDGIHLAGCELRQQRVIKHHALGGAKAGEIGVGVRTALAAVHDKKALGLEAAARHQLRHTVFEFLVVQRFEFIEPGRNDGGVKQQHQEVESHPHAPGPQPPVAARGAHHPQDQRDQGQAQQNAD